MHNLSKALEWDTPPRAKRDLRLHADYLDSFQDPLPPPADSPAQANRLSLLHETRIALRHTAGHLISAIPTTQVQDSDKRGSDAVIAGAVSAAPES